jgi:hypothetical protein
MKEASVLTDSLAMLILSRVEDLTTLDDAELGVLLEQLERDERSVSKRRGRLHDRIAFVRGGGFAALDSTDDQLERLQEAEREVSQQRAFLHRRISQLRSELNRRTEAA